MSKDFRDRMYEAYLAGIFRPTKRADITYTGEEKLHILIDEYHRFRQHKENDSKIRLFRNEPMSFCNILVKNKRGLVTFLTMKEIFYSPDIDEVIKKLRICRSLTYGVKHGRTNMGK